MCKIRSFPPGTLKQHSQALSHPRHVLMPLPGASGQRSPSTPSANPVSTKHLPSYLHRENLERFLDGVMGELCGQDWSRYAIVYALLQRCASEPLACDKRLSLAQRLLQRQSPPKPRVFVRQASRADEARSFILQQFQRAGQLIMQDGGRSPQLMASAQCLLKELWALDVGELRSYELEAALHEFTQLFLEAQLSQLLLKSESTKTSAP